MKEIYILRHAKSSWDNINLADFDGPLAKKGIDDAKRVTEILKDFNKNNKIDTKHYSKALNELI